MNSIKTKILTLLLCLLMGSYTQAQTKKDVNKNYFLEGQIAGLENGTIVKLVPGATHSNEPAVAETTVDEGKFTLIGKLEGPRFFYIVFGENKGSISVFLENNVIKLTAVASISNEEDGKITFKNEVITGSKSQDYYAKEAAFRADLDIDYKAYHKDTEELGKIYSNARAAGNKARIDSIANTVEWKNFKVKEKAFFAKVQRSTENVIIKNKTTWWGAFFMMQQYSYLKPEQKSLFDQLSGAVQKSYYGQLVEKEVNPQSLVGTNISSFKLNDKDGNPITIKDVFSGKKYVLIDFWASWCAPCRKEIPNLKTAYTNYSEKGFEVLSISIDEDQKAWQKALGQENMLWPNLHDDNNVSKAFNVKTIPATFLVDKKGVIVSDNLRGPALEKKLEELLKS